MGWFATNALRESRLLRRFLNLPTYLAGSDGGVDGIVDSAGNTIDFGLPVYTYGQQPNPYAVPKYTEILIDPACLTGSGATTQGIKLRSDLVNWRFADAGQVLYANSGSIATPLVSGVAAGAFTTTEVSMWGSLNPIMIPAFMLYKGFRGRLKCTLIKSGTTAGWEIWIRIGKTPISGGVAANDQLFLVQSLANANNGQYQVDVEFAITSAGVSVNGALAGETTCGFTTKLRMTPNLNITGMVVDKGALMSTVDDAIVNINIRGTTGDTFSLLDYNFTAFPT